MTDDTYSGAPLDISTLELLAQRARTHPLVDRVAFEPDRLSPRRLVLHLDARQYPSVVEAARLDIRWFEGGDYSLHYSETHEANRWQCRWDRHPKPTAPHAHFHPPPDAGSDVEQSPIDDGHPLGALFDVLDWSRDRVEQLHESDD